MTLIVISEIILLKLENGYWKEHEKDFIINWILYHIPLTNFTIYLYKLINLEFYFKIFNNLIYKLLIEFK